MLVGVKCVLGYVPMEQHRQCMVNNPGPPCSIEPSILEMMTRPNIERAESGVVFSPSSLSTCHRQVVLQGKHDYYLDVKGGYKRVRGTIVHQGMGAEPPYPGVLGVVRELRMSAPIETKHGVQTFHGKPDLVVLLGVDRIQIDDGEGTEQKWINRLRVKIVDYKTKDEIGHDLTAAARPHVYQINMYAFLVQKYLPGYLRGFGEFSASDMDDESEADYYSDHLFLNKDWPLTLTSIDEVVVDELSIQYLDMKRTRAFSSKGFLYDSGKMLSDYRHGRWIRRKPAEHEELELEPIHHFSTNYIESIIRKGIEEQVEAESVLAPPLEGEDARIMCSGCPVRQVCYDIGRQEGYGMEDQAPYVNTENKPPD